MSAGYRDIADRLRDQIDSGQLQPGDQLPTEQELSTQYGVTRVTVRRALDVLKREGLIDAVPRRGTRVRQPPVRLRVSRYGDVVNPARERSDLGPWETACAVQGRSGRTELVSVQRVAVDAAVAGRLGVEVGEEAFHRRRYMWLDDAVAQLQDAWIPVALAEGTPLAGGAKVVGGVYAAFVRAGVVPASLTDEVTPRHATPGEREEMGLPEGALVAEIWQTSRDRQGRAIEVRRVVSDVQRVVLVYDDMPISRPEGV